MKPQKILSLKPTQMAIGMKEVQLKVDEIKAMKNKKRNKEIIQNPLKVILAPNRKLFIVNGHHRAFAYWLCGIELAPVKVIHRFPKSVKYNEFWKTMLQRKWAHPYGAAGEGPKDPLYFPQDIRGVGDDPYRSLAWLARESGGYEETQDIFADFKWAQYLRDKKIIIPDYEIDFKAALKKALLACQKKSASHLPGFKKTSSLRRSNAKTSNSK
ncbi:MAG: ParB/Srx family N-terminal domain-containing protein [Pseudobdellovibrionaceae bacterium]